MGNGDKDNDFADGGPTLIKLDASLAMDLDTAYLLCSLQANFIEPSIGRKSNVIQAMDSIIFYYFHMTLSASLVDYLLFTHLLIYYKQC